VIEHAMTLAQSSPDTVFIKGNHEELLIRVWDGDRATAATFHRAGGRETLISYGITAEQYDSWDLGEVTDATTRVVPKAHIDFLRAFRPAYRLGDYYFTHAGVRPGIALDDQDETDLRWIRSDFIESTADFGAVVVHGHTIRDEVEERANRIGIDTGAYASGRLTAIGLQGTDRWYLST
jgi:serine/threonine protein phosphatase 1